ncbi:NEL-type E3 ubiquitin ligase domain-containing protein [Pseudomonas sp. RTB3]|nr:NEL-type E3 ubiquitin ligase domain-containing protein [Pseudomonas sp. RTB3]
MLYTVESYVTPAVLEDARTQLQRLGKSPALQEWLLMEAFWIEYLTKSHPEPFATVKETIEYKVQLLEKQLPSKQSDEYLERRQSLVDLENDEHNRLVRQLTLATQAALRRVSQASE